jgi:hypothetical protein
LPNDKAVFFARAEEMPTKSSGIEVAIAIIMKAAANSVSRKNKAIFARLLTRAVPLATRTRHASTKNNKLSNNMVFFCSFS